METAALTEQPINSESENDEINCEQKGEQNGKEPMAKKVKRPKGERAKKEIVPNPENQQENWQQKH